MSTGTGTYLSMWLPLQGNKLILDNCCYFFLVYHQMEKAISDSSFGETWYTDGKTYTSGDVDLKAITSDMLSEKILQKYDKDLSFCNLGAENLTNYFYDCNGWLYFCIGENCKKEKEYCRFNIPQIKEWKMRDKNCVAVNPKDIENLLKIVDKLEKQFPGRKFSLDGHLLGSIGEVMAQYYYDIELYKASHDVHDGKTDDGREVQVKITQGKSIALSSEPKNLIVLKLNKENQKISEIYNGTGDKPWNSASKMDKRGCRHLSVNKLIDLNAGVPAEDKIIAVNHIDIMTKSDKK